MRSRAPLAVLTVGALLVGRRAAAQPEPDRPAFRFAVEGYLAQYELDNGIGSGQSSLGGFGARLTSVRDERRGTHSLADRAVGGVFATYTARQGSPDVTTLHVGVETDVAILPTPIGGHLDPFFSLGLGLFRTSRENVLTTIGNGRRITRSDLALTPAVGTRVLLAKGVGLRGDLRAPFVFGAATSANFVAEGGLYVSF